MPSLFNDGPPRPQVLYPCIQPTACGKCSEKKFPVSSKKQNLNLHMLETIYIAFTLYLQLFT